MATGYKKCPNGHFYKDNLMQCPYCSVKGAGANANSGSTVEVGGGGAVVGGGATMVAGGGMPAGGGGATMVGGGGGMPDSNKTQIMPGGDGYSDGFGGNKTVQNQNASIMQQEPIQSPMPAPSANKTMIFDEESDGKETGGEVRSSRKLVGWLVSYTLSEMGVDFKLFEGRNIIGRDLDCQISVDDNTVSAKHAVLLFRAGRYSITDQQSTQGTFVNGVDIELAPQYLNDGDIIKVGKTIFKFRTSL